MSDMYTRGFIPLRRWQGSQQSIRWASDAEVRAEFGVPRAEFVQRWREMPRDKWILWCAEQRRKAGVEEMPAKPAAPLSMHQPGAWTGHKVQQPRIGGKR